MNKIGTDPTSEEVASEEDPSQAALLLRNSDNKRYGGIYEKLAE